MIFGGILENVGPFNNQKKLWLCDFRCQSKSGITGLFTHLHYSIYNPSQVEDAVLWVTHHCMIWPVITPFQYFPFQHRNFKQNQTSIMKITVYEKYKNQFWLRASGLQSLMFIWAWSIMQIIFWETLLDPIPTCWQYKLFWLKQSIPFPFD